MGGVSSTLSNNTMNIVNETTNKITSNMEKRCKNKTENIQDIKITIRNPIGCSVRVSGIGQTINSKVNAACLQTNISKVELQATLNNELDQFAETMKTAGSLELATVVTSNNTTNLRNAINNEQVLNEITTALNKTVNYQNGEILLDGVVCRPIITKDSLGNQTIHGDTIDVENINQTIISDIVFKGLQSSEMLNSAVIAVDNEVSQTAKATALGLFDGIATAGGPLVMIIALIVIGVIFAGGGSMMMKKQFGAKGGGASVGSNWRYFSFPAMMAMFVFIIIGGIVCIIATSMGLSLTEHEKKNAESAKESGTEIEPSENALAIIILFAISIGLWIFTLIVYILLFLSNETMTEQNARYTSTDKVNYSQTKNNLQVQLDRARTNAKKKTRNSQSDLENAKKNMENFLSSGENNTESMTDIGKTKKITYFDNMKVLARHRKLLLVVFMLLLFGSIGTGVGSIVIRSTEMAEKQEEIDSMVNPNDTGAEITQ